MLRSNQHHEVPLEPNMFALATGLYKEQVHWHDAAIGPLIAESDLFEPMCRTRSSHAAWAGAFITQPARASSSCWSREPSSEAEDPT